MHLDVIALRDFYYGRHLGALAQRRLQTALREFWPSVGGLSIAGYGFAAPFLRPFRPEAQRVLQMMPAGQGVIPWPREGPNVSILVEPYDWPFQTGFLDRIVLAHALEASEQPAKLLDECWRALAPEGRLLVIAPNRTGLWARRDVTPFGYGRPYSFDQIDKQLAQAGFGIERHGGALYFPPSERRWWLRAGTVVDRVGRRLDFQRLAGVLIVEAVKRVAAPRSGLRERATVPIGAWIGAPKPVPAGAPARDSARGGENQLRATSATARRLLTNS